MNNRTNALVMALVSGCSANDGVSGSGAVDAGRVEAGLSDVGQGDATIADLADVSRLPRDGLPRDGWVDPSDAVTVQDATPDAASADGWFSQMPPACANEQAYQNVTPGEFVQIAVLAGTVQGTTDVDQDNRVEILARGPDTTEDVPAGVVLSLTADGLETIVSTGPMVGLESFERADGVALVVGFSAFGDDSLPECTRGHGLSLLAYEVDLDTIPWTLIPISCFQPGSGAYWQRDLILDSDLDGNPEILTLEPAKLHELQGAEFALLYRDEPGPPLVTSPLIGGLASGDLDGDGYIEISLPAALDETTGPGAGRAVLRIVENKRENGGFVVTHQSVTGAFTSVFNVIGDVDGDGRLELLHGGPVDRCRNLALYFATADDAYGLLWEGGFHDEDFKHLGVARMGDTDGDGDQEIAIPMGCTIRVFEWQAGALVDIAAIDTTPHCGYPEVFPGDFDGDGADELAVTTHWSAPEQYLDPTGIQIWKRMASGPPPPMR